MGDFAHRVIFSAEDRTKGAFTSMRSNTSKLGAATKAVRNEILGLASAYLSIRGVQEIVRITDAFTNQQAQLRLVTASQEELVSVQNKLLSISNETRTSQETSVTLFARLTRATRELNLAEETRLELTRLINQAGVVSGATTQEQTAAIIQLSQGLAAGALRGEEFNSVMEQTPRLAQALADGLGVTIGELRAMAKEGQLTAEVVTKALLSQADVINNEFAKVPVTAGGAFTQLSNTVRHEIGERMSPALTEFIASFATNLPAALAFTEEALNNAMATLLELSVVINRGIIEADEFARSLLDWIPALDFIISKAPSLTDELGAATDVMEGLAESMRLRAADAAKRYEQLLSGATRATQRFSGPAKDATTAADLLGNELDDGADKAKKFREEIERLIDKYDPLAAKKREIESALSKLIVAFANGEGDVDRLARAIGVLTDELEEMGRSAEHNMFKRFLDLAAQAMPRFIEEAREAESELSLMNDELMRLGQTAEDVFTQSEAAWLSFFNSLTSDDTLGALQSLFSLPIFTGTPEFTPEDGVGPPTPGTPGIFGSGGELNGLGVGALAGLSGLAGYSQDGTGAAVGAVLSTVLSYYFGAIGGAIGTAIGALFDSVEEGISEIRVPNNGAPFAASSSDDLLQTAFGDIWIRSGVDGFHQIQREATRQLRSFFETMEGMLSPEQIAAVAADLPANSAITTSSVEDGSFLRPFLQAVVNNMDPVVQSLTGRISDMTQALERFQAAMALFESVFQTDAVADYAEEVRKANLTMVESIGEIGQEARDLARDFNGTVSAMDGVTAATDKLHQAAMEAFRRIDAASRNITDITGGSIEQLRFMRVGNDPGAQISFLQRRANQLTADLENATSPEQIQEMVQRINALTMQAVQLNPTTSNIDAAIAFLEQVEGQAQQRLEDIRAEVTNAYDRAIEDIRTLIQASAQAQADAANTIDLGGREIGNGGRNMQTAAAVMYQAASLLVAAGGGGPTPPAEVNA